MQVALTYRARLMFSLASALFPVLLLFVWLTVAAESSITPGWGTSRIASHYVGVAVVTTVANSGISWAWDADLRSGELSSKLLRPVPVFHQFVAAEAGSRIVTGAILMVLVSIATLAIPDVTFPVGAGSWLAAVAATVLAFCLAALMSSTFGLVGFWSTQSSNLYLVWWGLGAFVSGLVAPLALMPTWLRQTAQYLPFRYALGFPVEIAVGASTGTIVTGFCLTGLWLAVFAGAYMAMWRRGIRRYQAVGG